MSPRSRFVLTGIAVVSAGLLVIVNSPWKRDSPASPQQAIALAPVVQQLRSAMTEHYLERRSFPATVEQLELPPIPPVPGLEAWSVSAAGVIELRLVPGQADGGGRLYHVAQVGPAGITWKCVAETASLAARAPGCTHVAGFVPPTVVAADPPSLGPVAAPPRLDLRKTDGTVVKGFATEYSSPEAFEQLDSASRRDVVAALVRNHGDWLRLDVPGSVQSVAFSVASLGKAAQPALDDALADAEGVAAVTLLVAACRVERARAKSYALAWKSGDEESLSMALADAGLATLEACLDARAVNGRAAAELVLNDVMAAVKVPERGRREGYFTALDSGYRRPAETPMGALETLSALATHARTRTEALIPLLHAYPTDAHEGSAALVGRVLLRLGLADAAAPDAAALAEEGLARMFAAAVQPRSKAGPQRGELLAPSAAALATRVAWTPTLAARFTAVARRVGNACERIDRTGVRSLGPHAVRAILEVAGSSSGCEELPPTDLLAEMLKTYPDTLALVPALARQGASREVAISALLELRDASAAPGPAVVRALQTLGWLEVRTGKQGPVFPASVRWPGTRVLKSRRLDASQLAALPAPLRTALEQVLAGARCPGTSRLDSVTEFTLWAHPAVPIQLARMQCNSPDGNGAAVVHASLAPGNKVERVMLPARLNGMYEEADLNDPITDVDGDGLPEIVTQRTIYECDGGEDCPDESVYAHDFSELDGNRFTWFRNR